MVNENYTGIIINRVLFYPGAMMPVRVISWCKSITFYQESALERLDREFQKKDLPNVFIYSG
jgi:hypothetical protein